MNRVSVLFVCLGNICRSPTAEGVFRQMVSARGLDQFIKIDSAGTSSWHVGQAPDERAIAAAAKRGIDLSHLRGRQASAKDFSDFDYVIAMDRENYGDLLRLVKGKQQDKLHLFLHFASGISETEVPDPYYGGGFPHVLDLIENAAQGLLDDIMSKHA